MRPPPPPRKCNLQGGQGPSKRGENTPTPQLPPVSPPIPIDTQAHPQADEPRRKRDFKLFTWGLAIAACGLLVLAAGTLAIRQELGYELRRLVAEYEAKKRDLVSEYAAKKRDLETQLAAELANEGDQKKRELVAEYEAKKRNLVNDYAAKTQKLVAEYQANKDHDDTATRQAVAEYKHKEEQLVAEYDRRLEAMQRPDDASAERREAASIFDTRPSGFPPIAPVPFGILSPDDLHETERLGSDWRDKVDWNSPEEFFGKLSRPDRVEALRYQYFVDGDSHPITSAEVEEYLALPQFKRMAVCSLSRRRLLTMRNAGAAYPPQPQRAVPQ